MAIQKREFEGLLNSQPEVMQKFIKLLASNVTEKKQLLYIAFNSLCKKVAEVLLTMKSKFWDEDQKTCKMATNRENLAAIAGTSTESLVRTSSDFKTEKSLTLKKGLLLSYSKIN